MAFAQPINTRGVTGGYIRPVAWRMDDNARELSALFALYVDKAHSDRCKPSVDPAHRERPLVEIVAKLRVSGERYEQAFGSEARVAAAAAGVDIVAMLYDAAQAISREQRRTGREDPEAHVICDHGGDIFAGAALA
jgi:hypothetical protein